MPSKRCGNTDGSRADRSTGSKTGGRRSALEHAPHHRRLAAAGPAHHPRGAGVVLWAAVAHALLDRPRRHTAGDSPASDLNMLPTTVGSLLRDLPIMLAGLALFYGLLSLTRYWTGPVDTQPEIHLHPI